MPLSRQQLDVVRRARAEARRQGATRIEKLALVAALGVESNYTELRGGDRDSTGALQQRPSQGWGPVGESLEKDVSQFLKHARSHRGKITDPGQLAQAVQRSAFPERYGQRLPEAKAALRAVRGKGGGKSTLGRPGVVRPGQAPKLTPGSTTTDNSGAMLAALMDKRKDMSLLDRFQEQVATGSYTVRTPPKVTPGKGAKYLRGSDPKVGGKRDGPASSSEIAELFWRGPGAVNIKDGKKVGRNFVDGHTSHVHVAADRAIMERIVALARRMDLNVGEYGKGITSGHAPNSNHYKPFGAADISGARMAEFARRVARGDF